MAKRILSDPFILIDGFQVGTSYGTQLAFNLDSEEQDCTTFGNDGWRSYLSGLKSWNLSITAYQDYDNGQLDEHLFSVFAEQVPVVIRATTDPVGPDNPEYRGTGVIKNYTPINGSVGAVLSTTIEIRPSATGEITRHVV